MPTLESFRRSLERRLSIFFICGHTYWSGALGKDSVVVDLGANRGEFSFHAVATHGCRCHAVEPDPAMRAEIQNKAAGDPRIKTYSFLICGEDSDRVPFKVYADTSLNNMFLTDQEPGKVIHVQGKRFDTFLREAALSRIDLLKIDIEGAETLLFETASDESLLMTGQITMELHDFVPALKMEKKVEKIIRRLQELGFSYYRFSWPHHADVVFINPRRLRLPFWVRVYFTTFPLFLKIRNGWIRRQWA